jgi:hypothetical protein
MLLVPHVPAFDIRAASQEQPTKQSKSRVCPTQLLHRWQLLQPQQKLKQYHLQQQQIAAAVGQQR